MRPLTATLLLVVAAVSSACAGASASDEATVEAAETAVVVTIDDGLTYLVADDAAVRIQQPGAAELDELEADGVRLGHEVTQLAVASEPTGSRFVMVPPDGPGARLHLLVDDVLHPVVTAPRDGPERAGGEQPGDLREPVGVDQGRQPPAELVLDLGPRPAVPAAFELAREGGVLPHLPGERHHAPEPLGRLEPRGASPPAAAPVTAAVAPGAGRWPSCHGRFSRRRRRSATGRRR